MIKISNNRLAGSLVSCFNPSLVYFQGKMLLFYRFTSFTSHHTDGYTRIAFVELDSNNFQPVSKHQPVYLPTITTLPPTFDDPRAFVWRGKLWIMYVQSVKSIARKWSSAVILSQIDLDGKVIQTHIPDYGRNINYAVSEDAPLAQEKNWSPLVIEDDLYLVYEINPLTVIKFQPENNTFIQVSCSSWKSHFQTYLSGSTPLIPWRESEYIGLFHTFEYSESIRTYSMGFYTLDVTHWRVTHISPEPILIAKAGIFKKLFGKFIHKFQYSGYSNYWLSHYLQILYRSPWNVIFPCEIVDYGKGWAVSIGDDGHNCCIEIYDKVKISESLSVVR